MRGTLMLPVEDWETLRNLGLGTAVLQLGTGDGNDTASLAQGANMVVSAVACPRDEDEDEDTAYDRWYANVVEARQNHRVMAVRAPWPAVAETFVSGSFGMVFIHPPFLGKVTLEQALDQAQRLSSTVVVTVDQIPYRAGAVVKAASKGGWSRTQSGRLWVLRYNSVHAAIREMEA